jgi:outer membrane immunogenic protein
LALALALGLMTPADAEDWTGLKLTLGLGADATDIRDDQSFSTDNATDTSISPYAAIGYDWAFDGYTMGVLADLQVGGYDTSDMISDGKGTYTEADLFATLRGKVGVPVNDRFLVYASGGLALLKVGATGVDISGSVTGTESQTLKGRSAGLGVDYALSPGRSLTVEYLYSDFEQSDRFFGSAANSAEIDPIIQSLRIGYSFRF